MGRKARWLLVFVALCAAASLCWVRPAEVTLLGTSPEFQVVSRAYPDFVVPGWLNNAGSADQIFGQQSDGGAAPRVLYSPDVLVSRGGLSLSVALVVAEKARGLDSSELSRAVLVSSFGRLIYAVEDGFFCPLKESRYTARMPWGQRLRIWDALVRGVRPTRTLRTDVEGFPVIGPVVLGCWTAKELSSVGTTIHGIDIASLARRRGVIVLVARELYMKGNGEPYSLPTRDVKTLLSVGRDYHFGYVDEAPGVRSKDVGVVAMEPTGRGWRIVMSTVNVQTQRPSLATTSTR